MIDYIVLILPYEIGCQTASSLDLAAAVDLSIDSFLF
jgi:hypothetical protein